MLIIFFIGVMVNNGLAEGLPDNGDLFDDIKIQMITASQKNKKLAVENKTLKAQLISLQLEIEKYEQEIGMIDPEYINDRKLLNEKKTESTDRDDSEGDALIQEAQNIYLSGPSMMLDEGQRLRELQLYDYQYEKQELQLDIQSMEFLHQKIKERRRPELGTLQKDIEENVAKSRNVALRIAEQEKAALSYPQEIDLLKMENEALKKKIKQLKRLLSE